MIMKKMRICRLTEKVISHNFKSSANELTPAPRGSTEALERTRTMTKITTAAEARAHILAAIEAAGREEVMDAIVQWNNTTDNDISEDGSVWVSNPQTGHWLGEDKLISFAEFLN